MAKKSKRQLRREETPSPGAPVSGNGSRPSDFNPDYTYVIQDLRRIGILAGSFMVILVVLSFFLR